MKEQDELYMRRALELAALGRGSVSPNPMVGCVIVHNGRIIGEGWHQLYGGPHAEVNAVASVKEKELLPEATVYVTLEPCSHYGKTPPCASLLITHSVKKVVICNTDTNPLVAGKGIQLLQEAGIEVATGVLEQEGKELNKRFFTFMEKQRPYIILKWAQTSDGFIAREDFSSKWISNSFARKLVHKWRAEEDAIMVGKNTALYDNPQLNVRSWTGRNPQRIIIDRNLQLPSSLYLFDGTQPTICYNYIKTEQHPNLLYVKIDAAEDIVPPLLHDMHSRKIQSVIVEGGSWLLKQFLKSGLGDEVRVFVSQQQFSKGIEAPTVNLLAAQAEDVAGDTYYMARFT
jgi:diaminohydroxyphosphoribosylaminopyrimidine deaminase/5-amino-6-(5-phosphoribosylamino)uracil reductase